MELLRDRNLISKIKNNLGIINSLLETQSEILGRWRNSNRNSQKLEREEKVKKKKLIKNEQSISDPEENIKQLKINGI